MSTGQAIRLRAAMKPLSTLRQPGGQRRCRHQAPGRRRCASGPTPAPSPPPAVVAEQMVAWVLAAEMARMFGGDTVARLHRGGGGVPAPPRRVLVATLWLVGMMGAGKSTVGPLVAERLGRPFVDLDEAVAAAAGRSIPAMFAAEGEAGFRRREAAALAATAGTRGGGGLRRGHRGGPGQRGACMRRSGMVAWLAAPAAVLADRVGDGAGRPLAARAEPTVAARLAAREAAYAAAAHCRVETAGRTPEEVAEEVVRRWSESG